MKGNMSYLKQTINLKDIIMKRFYILITLLLLVLPCFSQDVIKVHVTYNRTNQFLIVEVNNTSNDTSFLIYGQNSETSELSGSCIYVSKTKRQDYNISDMYKEQFPLIEFDSRTNTSNGKCPRLIELTPLKKICYGISLKDKGAFFDAKGLYVKVKLIVMSETRGAKLEAKHSVKVYDRYVNLD